MKSVAATKLDLSADRAATFDIANRAFFRLYQASNLLHKTGTRYVAEFGATTQQWAVLGALARPRNLETGLTVKELLEFLEVSRQNLTPLLDRLEGRGWVERVRDPADGRNRRVRLTQAGRSVWDAMQVPISQFYLAALEGFSEAECLQLFRLLDRLKIGMELL